MTANEILEDEIKCPFCSELIKVDAKVCKHCKSQIVKLETITNTNDAQIPIKNGYGWRWIPIILAVIFLGGFAVNVISALAHHFIPSLSQGGGVNDLSDAKALASRTDLSDLKNTGVLADAFNLDSKYTDLQREKLLKDIKGKVVDWVIEVYEIKKSGSNYTIQTPTRFAKEDSEVALVVELTTQSKSEDDFIAGLKTGDRIRIKGVLTGETTLRSLEVQPAIFWNPEIKAPVQATDASAPVSQSSGDKSIYSGLVGKSPSEVFGNDKIRELYKQSGTDISYDEMASYFNVYSSDVHMDSVFLVGDGCVQHMCGSNNAIFFINTATDKLHILKYDQENTNSQLSGVGIDGINKADINNPKVVPESVKKWMQMNGFKTD